MLYFGVTNHKRDLVKCKYSRKDFRQNVNISLCERRGEGKARKGKGTSPYAWHGTVPKDTVFYTEKKRKSVKKLRNITTVLKL